MATEQVFRRIPTDLFEQPDFVSLEAEEQVLLLWLILKADDHGRGKAGHDDPNILFLEKGGYVQLYALSGQEYYSLVHWQQWQQIANPAPSRFPAPPQEGK